MNNIKDFGPNLRSAIKRKGYKTYKSAADAFGISLSYLNQLMRNEREPSLELLKLISDELGVSASMLIGDKIAPTSQNETPSQPPDRANLILAIQARLTTLDDRELGLVSGFLDDLDSSRASDVSPTVRAK